MICSSKYDYVPECTCAKGARCTSTVGGSRTDWTGYGARGPPFAASACDGLADNGEEPPGGWAVQPTKHRAA